MSKKLDNFINDAINGKQYNYQSVFNAVAKFYGCTYKELYNAGQHKTPDGTDPLSAIFGYYKHCPSRNAIYNTPISNTMFLMSEVFEDYRYRESIYKEKNGSISYGYLKIPGKFGDYYDVQICTNKIPGHFLRAYCNNHVPSRLFGDLKVKDFFRFLEEKASKEKSMLPVTYDELCEKCNRLHQLDISNKTIYELVNSLQHSLVKTGLHIKDSEDDYDDTFFTEDGEMILTTMDCLLSWNIPIIFPDIKDPYAVIDSINLAPDRKEK